MADNQFLLSSKQVEKQSPRQLLETLETSLQGLSNEEAQNRLKSCGPNALTEQKENSLLQFLKFFWGPIPWMIEIAALLSFIASDMDDFLIIMFMLLFNGVLGFMEEHKATNALDALKKGLALKARVMREGEWGEVDAATLVPGDIIKIRLGDVVPADAKCIQGDYISIDQAALTGESLPVNKKVGDIAYSGSIAKQGEMLALITGTGSNTFFGRTAKLVATAGNVSHFQQAVLRIGNFLIILSIVLCVLLSAIVLYRDHISTGNIDFHQILGLAKFVLILAVASIPVAMPAVLSVTMALGAVVMSKHKAIVSKLDAIEEMAGVDVLCSDKTGTLTKNKLTLAEPILFAAKNAQELILSAALASKKEDKDAIDLAMIQGVEDQNLLLQFKQTAFTPFDPISKRTQAQIQARDNNQFMVTKGAPQVIIDLCQMPEEEARKAAQYVTDFAGRGYRALGVARSDDNGQTWIFSGLVPMFDPPRDDSKETIEEAKKHGLDVKMVTGDDTAIGAEISGQLGMGTHIQPAADTFEGIDLDKIPDELCQSIERADGFARVFPEHKYAIVKALQQKKHIVAMTGDGVNDAPALKQADAGVAVSGATDAARAAAALILTEPGLSVIIRAIETARQIFERMMSYTIYRIGMTINVMFFVVLAMIFFPTLPDGTSFKPISAVMIIILALLDDIPIMTIAYDNTRIEPKPVRWQMGKVLSVASILGGIAVLETFGLLALAMHGYLDLLQGYGDFAVGTKLNVSHIQSIIFLELVGGGHLMLFVTRSKKFFFQRPWPSMTLFTAIMGTQVLAMAMCGMGWIVPQIPWVLVGAVGIYNLVWMFIQDIAKCGTYKILNNATRTQQEFLQTTGRTLKHQSCIPYQK